MASSKPRYDLQCTAGPAYDLATHGIVPVNGAEGYRIETDLATVVLYVRIQEYTGLPRGSLATHPYFAHPDHLHDRYSLEIALTPKRPVSGNDLVFGNDFDRPIRDRMPPGSNYALKIVKWWVDPGLEGDAYADQPYLYGPALSSWNHIRICGLRGEDPGAAAGSDGSTDGEARRDASGSDETSGADGEAPPPYPVVEEGAEGSGVEQRRCFGIPDSPDQRRKFFLTEANRTAFTFEEGRLYKADFGNSYISFSDFSLRLPGFKVVVTDYIDEKHHELRYVLKNKVTGDLYFSLRFNLPRVR
ncbi:hypothetical protein KEM52_006479 [Ascosphaera acerosa]|nr:hypothetical protein KEM52_006479 [Ascosphaera acerosa]